jgi:hypothetical protein
MDDWGSHATYTLKRDLRPLAVIAVIGTFTRDPSDFRCIFPPNCLPITPAHLPDGRLSNPGGWLIATAVLYSYGGSTAADTLFSWRLFQASHYALQFCQI